MQFGKSFNDVRKEINESSSGNSDFIKYPKASVTTLRVLDEPEKWLAWWEHFDQGMVKSYPCTGDRDSCPGCTSDNERTKKASRKVGMNALSERDGKWYVDYWKFGVTIVKQLENRAKRYETITDRDYTIMKSGTGMDTEYDVETEPKNPIDLSQYEGQKKNGEAMLAAAYEDAWGDGTVDDAPKKADKPKEPTATPVGNTGEDEEVARLKAQLKAARDAAKPEPEPEKPENEVERMRRELAEVQAKVAKQAPEGSLRAQTGDVEDPPTEPEADQNTDASGEEPNLSLEDLKAMTKAQLLALVNSEIKAGRLPEEPVSSKTKSDLLEWLLDNS